MSRLRLALVAAAAVAAAALALVGLSVLSSGEELAADQRALAAGAPAVVEEPGAGGRIGDTLLGTGAARDYFRALALARESARDDQPDAAALALRAEAEAILARVVRGDAEPLLRSRAANLLGVLLFEDAKVARQSPRRFLDQSIGAFQDAVTLDPAYAAAKRNLELLATLPARTNFRREGSTGTEPSSSGGAVSGY